MKTTAVLFAYSITFYEEMGLNKWFFSASKFFLNNFYALSQGYWAKQFPAQRSILLLLFQPPKAQIYSYISQHYLFI